MKKLLLAVDGSEVSARAAEMAALLLNSWPRSELIVLYVSPIERIPPEGLVPQLYLERPAEEVEELRTVVLNDWFKDFAERVRFRNFLDSPAAGICRTANEENVDWIILGSHGKGAVDRLLMGSVSTAVLHKTQKHVLVVK